MAMKKALCLSGGGARGSFQMGAVRCLYEAYGFRPDVISGTSVGSVNGIKLAAAPPPINNDAQAFLANMRNGQIDAQLTQMRGLEQLWLSFLTPANFFMIRPPFRGTLIEDVVRDLNSPTYSGPLNTTINPMLDIASVLINIPIVNLIAGPMTAARIQEFRVLIEKISVENSLLDLSPIELQLRDPSILDPVALAGGTPLYLAMVALESGRLRYVTNKSEFFERDGVTPVATALMDADVDAALDENLQPLGAVRNANVKAVVSGYKTTVGQISAYRAEYNTLNTTTARRRALAGLIAEQVERGNYFARAARQQIRGLRITAKVDPVVGVLGSACMPVYFDPPVVGVERYVDGGVREIIPVEVVLRHNPEQLVGIVCTANELPETDSMDRAGLVAVAMRSLLDIALEEVVVGDLATAASKGIDTRFIVPEFNVHDTVVVQPSLIEISMHYGWMRAADEMQPAVAAERIDFRQSSGLIARLRLKCLSLERNISGTNILDIGSLRSDYLELRTNRWTIMHLVAARNRSGLPAQPTQASWSIDWEREFRGTFGATNVWSQLESRSSDNAFQADLWPASSPTGFNPDSGAIRDAGSARIYWLVRGAIFEARDGSPPPTGATFTFPNGTHQYLARIPTGMHLMAEVQDPGTVWLVAGDKKYAAPSPQIIAAAGLSGARVALLPQGGLMQIPDGGVPSFLGSLAFVDQANRPLTEVLIERVEQSNTIADLSLYNPRGAALSGISVTLEGFDVREGLSVESSPASLAPNSIDFTTLRLQPTRTGEFVGSVVVNSSDPLFPVISVPLKIRVEPLGAIANLRFSPDPLEVSARVNTTNAYAMLTVTNDGAISPDTLTSTVEPPAAQSLFVPGTNIVATSFTPGRAVQIPIFCYPTVAGRFNAELVLTYSGTTSNGFYYQKSLKIPLVGNAGASKIRLAKFFLPVTPFPSPPRPFPPIHVLPRPPASSLSIDVGTVQPPLNDVTDFYIGNVGELALQITTIRTEYASISLAQNLRFPLMVAPGQQQQIRLDLGVYRAPGSGRFSETIWIVCDDPVTPEATVILSGVVGGIQARINPEFLDFKTVAMNAVATLSASFENSGTVDLHISKITWQFGSQFTIVQGPTVGATLAAGKSLSFTVNCSSGAAGVFADRLIVGTEEGLSASLGMQARFL